jgi:hypothetical protein
MSGLDEKLASLAFGNLRKVEGDAFVTLHRTLTPKEKSKGVQKSIKCRCANETAEIIAAEDKLVENIVKSSTNQEVLAQLSRIQKSSVTNGIELHVSTLVKGSTTFTSVARSGDFIRQAEESNQANAEGGTRKRKRDWSPMQTASWVMGNIRSFMQGTSRSAFRSSELGRQARASVMVAIAAPPQGKGDGVDEEDRPPYAAVAEVVGCHRSTYRQAQGRRGVLQSAFEEHGEQLTTKILVNDVDGGGDVFACERKERCDVTPQILVSAAREFSHDGEVAQATGNKNMTSKDGKGKSAPVQASEHSVHFLRYNQEETYRLFLQSAGYQAAKQRLVEEGMMKEDDDMCSTVFHSHFRCHCHKAMVESECACIDHMQFTWWLEALRMNKLGKSLKHPVPCDCECHNCSNGDCDKIRRMVDNPHAFASEVLCKPKDWYENGPDTPFQCETYSAECVHGTCQQCGFVRAFPDDCKYLQLNEEDNLTVKQWGDVEAGGKTWKREVVEVSMSIAGWFKQCSKFFTDTYIIHHVIAKFQKTSHDIALAVFPKSVVVIECDFSEKHTIKQIATPVCGNHPQATLFILLAHYNPVMWVVNKDGVRKGEEERKERRHYTDVWAFVSDDKKQDAYFYEYCLKEVVEHYKKECAELALPLEELWVFTDGCAKQFKGKVTFKMISTFMEACGLVIRHFFAASSHFKGPHDGYGGTVKRKADRAVVENKVVLNKADDFYTLTKDNFENTAPCCDEEYFGHHWSRYRIRETHTRWVDAEELVDRPSDNDAVSGIPGTMSTYSFMGPAEGEGRVVTAEEEAKKSRGAEWEQKFKLYTRKLTCMCSSCRVGKFSECKLKEYEGLIGELTECFIKERIGGSPTDGKELSELELKGLKVNQLKSICKQRNLPTIGLKAALVSAIHGANQGLAPTVVAPVTPAADIPHTFYL